MKYTKELTDQILHLYTVDQVSVPEIAKTLSTAAGEEVPERSVIAKLSSLGVYKKKEYLTKRGEVPVKKEQYIERIAAMLDVQLDFLESLEKVNKSVLALIATKLDKSDPKLD
jgi:hypothetical protein